MRLFEIQITIQEKQGNKKRLATGLGNMAISQLRIGALGDAKRNLLRRIDLGREIGNEYSEANGHHDLSHVLSYCGKWEEAEQEHDRALNIVQKLSATQAEGTIWAHHAQLFLMMARNDKYSTESHYQSAVECARHALELADEAASIRYPVERDYVCAYWLLGASYRASGNLLQAEIHLNESLTRCRAINLVEMEANILLDLAHLRYDQENLEEAKSLAEEALLITERCGYVLQGADVHLFLASLALEGYKLQVESELSDKEAARLHAEKALELAYCDGPPYTYKVAYEEAERFLEKLK